MTALTADQYARQMGLQCPYCQSEAITPMGQMESDGGIAWREIACSECGGSWTESYGLVGYAGLNHPLKLQENRSACNGTRKPEVPSRTGHSLVQGGQELNRKGS